MLRVRELRRPGLGPVSFDLAEGEILALRGPSGTGKTLLLRALADLDPSQGEVVLDDRPRAALSGPGWRRLACYVAAEPGWWAETVAGHFADWPTVAPLAARLLLPTDVGARAVALLSTGERQRLALLRGLELGPHLLLLDEPTGPLDEASTAAVEELIRERAAGGLSALWSTHDPAQARRLGRRALRLGAGGLAEVVS